VERELGGGGWRLAPVAHRIHKGLAESLQQDPGIKPAAMPIQPGPSPPGLGARPGTVPATAGKQVGKPYYHLAGKASYSNEVGCPVPILQLSSIRVGRRSSVSNQYHWFSQLMRNNTSTLMSTNMSMLGPLGHCRVSVLWCIWKAGFQMGGTE